MPGLDNDARFALGIFKGVAGLVACAKQGDFIAGIVQYRRLKADEAADWFAGFDGSADGVDITFSAMRRPRRRAGDASGGESG